jgi:hypothetical protein
MEGAARRLKAKNGGHRQRYVTIDVDSCEMTFFSEQKKLRSSDENLRHLTVNTTSQITATHPS